MARQNTENIYKELRNEIVNRKFHPIYLLMGEEPYYTEQLCELIIENALQPVERDFNQYIFYGMDATAENVVAACEQYPMMAERVLVVVKEAQMMKKIENIAPYLDHISETTVLVLLVSGKNLDKRTSFYKKITKVATVFESSKVSLEAMPLWIEKHMAGKGRKIEPEAAMLMAEFAGNDLRKIAVETDKLLKAIPEDQKLINSADIERNIGISREFNITELTNALASKNAAKAFKIAYYFGESPKRYPIQMTIGFLFFFFSKIEGIHAYMMNTKASPKEAAAKTGIYYSYADPYLTAVSKYSLQKTMNIIAYLKDYDYKSKSNLGGNASDGDILIELIGKILA